MNHAPFGYACTIATIDTIEGDLISTEYITNCSKLVTDASIYT